MTGFNAIASDMGAADLGRRGTGEVAVGNSHRGSLRSVISDEKIAEGVPKPQPYSGISILTDDVRQKCQSAMPN